MESLIFKVANILIYLGVALIMFCVVVLGDNDGDGQIHNKVSMIIGGVFVFLGGVVRIYRNLTR